MLVRQETGNKLPVYCLSMSRALATWNRLVEAYCRRRSTELTTESFKRRTHSLLLGLGRALERKRLACIPSRFGERQLKFVVGEYWAPRTAMRTGYALSTRIQWTGILNRFLAEHGPTSKLDIRGRSGGYVFRTADRAFPRVALSHEQVVGLVKAAQTKDAVVRGMIAFELTMGLRRSEVLRITVDQAQAEPMRFIGKGRRGGKWREVPSSRAVRKLLPEILERRHRTLRAAAGLDPGNLFCHIWQGKIRPYSSSWVDSQIKPLLQAAGFDAPGNLNHALRRTFGRTLWEGGVPIEIIAQLMGHDEIYTTMGYLSIDVEDKTRAMSILDSAFARGLRGNSRGSRRRDFGFGPSAFGTNSPTDGKPALRSSRLAGYPALTR